MHCLITFHHLGKGSSGGWTPSEKGVAAKAYSEDQCGPCLIRPGLSFSSALCNSAEPSKTWPGRRALWASTPRRWQTQDRLA